MKIITKKMHKNKDGIYIYDEDAYTTSSDGNPTVRVTDIEIDENNGFVYITGNMQDGDGTIPTLGVTQESVDSWGKVFLIKYDLNICVSD